jgi:invasion protein IalB
VEERYCIEGANVKQNRPRIAAGQTAHLVAGAMLMALAGTASAQQPQHTAETYGNWTVECDIQAGPPLQKTCNMAQIIQAKSQQTPIARLAISRQAKSQALQIEIQLPVNVWMPSGVKLQVDDKDPGLVAGFTRCIPGGCFADAELKPDTLAKFRASGDEAKMHLLNANQQEMVIPFGLSGFAQAFDVLSKE